MNLAPVEAMLEGDTGVTDTIHAAKQGMPLAPTLKSVPHPCCAACKAVLSQYY